MLLKIPLQFTLLFLPGVKGNLITEGNVFLLCITNIHSFRKVELISTMKCISSHTGKLDWNLDPSNISCVKDCMAYDNGNYQITRIGESRKLVAVPGYRWQNTDSSVINEIECKIKEYGNAEYIGEEEQHDLVDINECEEGIESALCPMKNSKCGNIPGSYLCVCNDGYMPFDNSKCTYRKNINIV